MITRYCIEEIQDKTTSEGSNGCREISCESVIKQLLWRARSGRHEDGTRGSELSLDKQTNKKSQNQERTRRNNGQAHAIRMSKHKSLLRNSTNQLLLLICFKIKLLIIMRFFSFLYRKS